MFHRRPVPACEEFPRPLALCHGGDVGCVRRSAVVLLAWAVVAGTAGCSVRVSREDASAASTAGRPPSAEAPAATEPPAATPTSPPVSAGASSTSSLGPARTDVPDGAVLPVEQAAGDAPGTVAWTLPDGCAADAPRGGAVMRTVTDGDGRFEKVARVQQVATFPDAGAAVAEAGRLARVMERCADDDGADTDRLRSAGPVAVGAQGYGLARRYDAGGEPAPFGTFAVVVRRGNALTLLAHTGGEISVQGSRTALLADAQAAWERLCLYDRTAGCPQG